SSTSQARALYTQLPVTRPSRPVSSTPRFLPPVNRDKENKKRKRPFETKAKTETSYFREDHTSIKHNGLPDKYFLQALPGRDFSWLRCRSRCEATGIGTKQRSEAGCC